MIETRALGLRGQVSAVSLGGGGIGGVYGSVDHDVACSTVRAAFEAGISLFDLAPSYGPGERSPAAELLVAEAFEGRIPESLRLTTKVLVAEHGSARQVRDGIRGSLEASLERLGREHIDFFFLHSYVSPPDLSPQWETVSVDLVRDVIRPEFERLRADGLIAEWGLSGIGHPRAICALLVEEPRPAVVQCVTNALDSVGRMWPFSTDQHPENDRIRETAAGEGVAVMGIRALAAGALADRLDRALESRDPTAVDFERARGFRALARSKRSSPASLAYRYALSIPGVSTVVTGAKTPAELDECLAAAAAEKLSGAEIAEIEATTREVVP